MVAVSCRCSSSWVTVAACAADWLALMQEGVSKRRACQGGRELLHVPLSLLGSHGCHPALATRLHVCTPSWPTWAGPSQGFCSASRLVCRGRRPRLPGGSVIVLEGRGGAWAPVVLLVSQQTLGTQTRASALGGLCSPCGACCGPAVTRATSTCVPLEVLGVLGWTHGPQHWLCSADPPCAFVQAAGQCGVGRCCVGAGVARVPVVHLCPPWSCVPV